MKFADKLYKIINANFKMSMKPNEIIVHKIDDDYTLKIRCYSWFIRNYSLWYHWECECHSNTIDWFLVQVAPELYCL